MGTLFRIVFYADDDSIAARAAEAAFNRIDTLNARLSDYRDDSELSLLPARASKQRKVISPDLWAVLSAAQQLARYSHGAFDITIGPLSRLWRRAFRRQTFPERERIEESKALVDYRQLELFPNDHSVLFHREGMRLDAGGIAKGYAVDQAMQVLDSFGIRRALIDGGGDLLAGAPPPGRSGWRIQLPIVKADGELGTSTLLLAEGAIATSGDTYRYLEWEGERYSHIIDPRSGLGVNHGALVTVQCPDCATADALASAVSVLGPGRDWKILQYHYSSCRVRLLVPEEEGGYRQLGHLYQK